MGHRSALQDLEVPARLPGQVRFDQPRTRLVPQVLHLDNEVHYHSGIGYLRPADLHDGIHNIILERRQATLEAAARQHPERFTKPPRPANAPDQAWINKPPIQTT